VSEPAVVLSDSPPEAASPERCAACGERLAGRFCHACGERRPTPEDERLAPFLREQFHEATSADGKLWRSLRALFVPGKLTEEYFSGRRGLYVRPVRIFLVVNILFFLLLGVTGGQAFRGDAELYRDNAALSERLDRAAAAQGVDPEVYDAAFGQQTGTLATTLFAVFVPLFAVLFAVVLSPLRVPLLRHVVFATHAVTVLMGLMVVIGGVLLAGSRVARTLWGFTALDNFDLILVPILLVAWIGYLVVGIQRVHRAPWWGAGAAGLVLGTVGTVLLLEVYQFVLFFAALWTVDVPA
jgi:hypothetical protein